MIKNKRMKKFGGLVLAITMIMLPMIVNADVTLQSKIDAASDNAVITLDKDYAESITIAAEKNITIDLNGYSITVSGADVISNYGNLIITGSGTVSSNKGAVVNYPGGEVTINDGHYHSTGWYAIKNMGTMTINNLKFDNDVQNGSSLIDNGFYGNSTNDRNQVYSGTDAFLTINGGTFENKNNSSSIIKNDDAGVLVINDGVFTSYSEVSSINAGPVILNWHKATINGGTFTSVNGAVLSNGYCDATTDIGELTINGGTFTSNSNLLALNGGATKDKGILTITNGSFDGNLNSFPSYYGISITGGTFEEEVTVDPGYDVYQVLNSEENKFVVASEDDLLLKNDVTVLEKEQVNASELTLIEETSKDYVIVGYFDIDLVKVTSDGYVVASYTESDEKMIITLSIPDDLTKVNDGYTRTYYIVRIHDGEVELLNAIDNGDGTVSFETDKFSTYALVYQDEINNALNEKASNPSTLDNILFYIITLIVSVCAVVTISLCLKKRFN